MCAYCGSRTSLYYRKHSTYAPVNLDSYLLYPSAGGRPYKQLRRPSKYRPRLSKFAQTPPQLPPPRVLPHKHSGPSFCPDSQIGNGPAGTCLLILPLFIPGSHFIFHREVLRRRLGKPRVQLIGLRFQRYRDPGTQLHKSSNVKFRVTVKAKKSHLRGMDQSVEERSQHDFIVKNNHVQVSNGSQVHEVWKVAGAESHGFGIKRRGRDAGALKNDRPDAVKQSPREISLYARFPSRGQWLARAKIKFSLPAQVCRHSRNHLSDAHLWEFNRIHRNSAFPTVEPDCTPRSCNGQ